LRSDPKMFFIGEYFGTWLEVDRLLRARVVKPETKTMATKVKYCLLKHVSLCW